jgi:nitrite reductase (NADH) small subunit
MTTSNEISAGRAADFPEDAFRIVTVAGREIGIARRADGKVHAVRNWCPHKGAPICKSAISGTMLPGAPGTLTFGMAGEVVRCPWHGFEFKIDTGERLFSQGRAGLRVYPARIDKGEILIDLGPRRSSHPDTEKNT